MFVCEIFTFFLSTCPKAEFSGRVKGTYHGTTKFFSFMLMMDDSSWNITKKYILLGKKGL